MNAKRVGQWIALTVFVVLVVCLAAEAVSWAVTPSWPARLLRDDEPRNPVSQRQADILHMPWLAQPYNSWGLRDAERSIKPTEIGRAHV